MKVKIYQILVNRHSGIKERYLKCRNGSYGIKKYLSLAYLLWLNFCYYVLFCRWLSEKEAAAIYEEKKLEIHQSESELSRKETPIKEKCITFLSRYDTISFDIFDTLLFRPFSDPTDVFYFIGGKIDLMNFKEIRIQAEKKAREKCKGEKGHYEVTLQEIWDIIEGETGISSEIGIQAEVDAERQFCYANPFMLEVYRELQRFGKKIILISDMYLPKECLELLLKENGYDGYSELYVSCEYGKSKTDGSLLALVHDKQRGRIVHIGDNSHSDIEMAKKNGFDTLHYPNINRTSKKYRAYDMSPIVGSAYRGIVNQRLYNGLSAYSMDYEYGFIYGGLFVAGYCAFIHEYCKSNQIDQLLFLSRDGDTLKKAYEIMFPEEKSEYAYWSRRAATKLMAGEDKHDYFRRFLFHKVNQEICLGDILESMELPFLVLELPQTLPKTAVLTDKNVLEVKVFLEQNWARILKAYEEEQTAAKLYYTALLKGCKKAVAVDIGWAGSGAAALGHLVQKVWGLPCEIIGVLAGTNTIHSAEPDTSEILLQSGRLVSYLYSQDHNREVMKKHNPDKNYNIYWELLLSSPTPSFKGFCFDKENGWKLLFGKYDMNQDGIREIQKGILDFVQDYKEHFEKVPFMYSISGRDAYAPMLLAACKEERYLKKIESNFSLQINIS